MISWAKDEATKLVRSFLMDAAFGLAKLILRDAALKEVLEKAGKYEKRLDVSVLFESKSFFFGLEGDAQKAFSVKSEDLVASVEVYEGLWALSSHLPKKRKKARVKTWWGGAQGGVVKGAEVVTKGVGAVYGGVWDAVEYLADFSLLRGILEDVVNAVLAGPLGVLGLTLASIELTYDKPLRKIGVGLHLGLKES